MEADEAVPHQIEDLNPIDLPRMPPHVLQLKIGVPIIMLRNINQPKLCNGMRFAVKKLMNNVEATILAGSLKDEAVLILRIPMIPMDMLFQFKQLQFPIRLAFAFIINKAHDVGELYTRSTKGHVSQHSFKKKIQIFTAKTLQFTDKRQESMAATATVRIPGFGSSKRHYGSNNSSI
ncbi:unnamed protein product [Onchocerca ochengi]|uniref:ATP-dependent DNA helicase n=1 Tax=Onchocerca ochengi TaxID=42157 RepID=A0A182DYS5_ONCOC|nr:unnamed protein product [Onchocerca ochengi]